MSDYLNALIARGPQVNLGESYVNARLAGSRNALMQQEHQQKQQAAAAGDQADQMWDQGYSLVKSGDPARVEQGKMLMLKADPEAFQIWEKANQPQQPGQLYQVDRNGVPTYLPADQAAGQPAWVKPENGGGSGFGNVNPGDYTPESLAKFAQTRNYADLVRQYAPAQPVFVNTPGYGAGIVDRNTGRPIATLTTPDQEAGAKAAQAGAEKSAAAAAEQQAGVAKKVNDAANANDVLAMADPLIDAATGSLVGAAYDKAANVFGYAPSGDEAISALQVLQAKLMLSMPRMEGPQSDRDVNLYREAAGQIGNPTIPRAKKKVAVQTIKNLNSKYASANAGAGAPAGAQGGTPPASALKEGTVTTFRNGQKWTLQNGQPVRVK